MRDPRPELAEALGVFALVFVGCGAIMVDVTTHALGHVGVSLAFGLVIVAMIYALGHVSGAHFNPAITIAFAATGHFPRGRVATYVVAQVAGATLAALALRTLLGTTADVGATSLAPGLAPWKGFAFEAIASFLLALVIVGVATDKRAAPGVAGLAIGFTVAFDALAFGPLTGASMNPARSLGPAIAAGHWGDLAIYVAAPLVGALVAMLAYEGLRAGRMGIAAKEPLGVVGPVEATE